MKRLFLAALLPIIFFSLGGCAINMPLSGKLDSSTIGKIQSRPPTVAKLAVYIDKDTRGKVISKTAEGYVGSGVNTNIPIGSALSNALIEALALSFSDLKVINAPDQPENFNFLKIKADTLDVGFEYSYFASVFLLRSALDKGRVSLVLNIQIINPDGKEILKEKYTFEESEIESATPPPSKAGVLERCLNRIAIQFAEKIRAKF